MSALKFLSKKSWHTGLIKNNEKVWLREQAEAKEKQRVAELQKQLEEERRLEEIQRLEIESGRLDPAEVKRRQRIEWMYEDGPTAHSKAAKEQEARDQEDTLLGKKSANISCGPREKDPRKALIIDAENKLREDPMLLIEKERRRALDSTRVKRPMHPDVNLSGEAQAKIAAKLARKAERREIREARKRRRAERDMAKKSGQDALEERRAGSATGRILDADKHRDVDNDARYGLRLPKGGSGVQVGVHFKPKKHITQQEERRSRRRDGSMQHMLEDLSFPTPNGEDRGSRREQMRLAAERLHDDRRHRMESQHLKNAVVEQEEERERLWGSRNIVGTQLSSKFALEAMRSRKNSHISSRILQKRSEDFEDGASY